METKKIEIEIDMDHLYVISSVFGEFMQENLEVLRETYIEDYLGDKSNGVTEAESPFPSFCFQVFLYELRKSFEKDERGTL